MGICVSSTAISSVPAATAKLIIMDGSIQEFFEGMTSREILQDHPSHFICNSDGLYVGQKISQVLNDDDQLETGKLYFLLPRRKLQFVLTDSDMASFLFKINSAWQSAQKSRTRSRRLSCVFGQTQKQVQPLFDIGNQHEKYVEECSSSSASDMPRRPKVQISNPRGRGRIQWQSKLETIEETV